MRFGGESFRETGARTESFGGAPKVRMLTWYHTGSLWMSFADGCFVPSLPQVAFTMHLEPPSWARAKNS